MTDATTAADPTTADPAATPAAATAEATPTDATAAAKEAPTTDWRFSLDDDGKKFVEAKGWKGPGDALAALKGYEPPESPEGYELPVPDGESPEFAKSLAPVLHKARLSATQAKALAEGWNSLQTEQRAAAKTAEENAARETEAVAKRQADDLKRDWGPKHDAKTEGARRAALAFTPGTDEASKMEFLTAMETRFGYDGMMKFWASIGDHMGEATAHGLGDRPPLPNKDFYDKSNMNP